MKQVKYKDYNIAVKSDAYNMLQQANKTTDAKLKAELLKKLDKHLAEVRARFNKDCGIK